MQPQSGEEPATPQQQQWQQCSTAQQQQQQDQPDTGTHKDTAGAHSTITVAHTQSDGVSSPLHTFKRQVTFPADDAIAVVHQLHPSSSAGDLCTPCYHEKGRDSRREIFFMCVVLGQQIIHHQSCSYHPMCFVRCRQERDRSVILVQQNACYTLLPSAMQQLDVTWGQQSSTPPIY